MNDAHLYAIDGHFQRVEVEREAIARRSRGWTTTVHGHAASEECPGTGECVIYRPTAEEGRAGG